MSIAKEPMTRPQATPRVNLVTAALASLLTVGLFLDGWAHANRPGLETFFTPWHGVLYSAFSATAGWLAIQAIRGWRAGGRGLGATPYGYGLGLLGAAGLALAGLADMAWHTAFGVERDVPALLSPPHLALAISGGLMITSPLRSESRRVRTGSAPSMGPFLPTLATITLVTTGALFFMLFASAFEGGAILGAGAVERPGGTILELNAQEAVLIVGVSAVLVTNALLMVAMLFVLRRWRPPFGSMTILFTTVALLSSAIHELATGAAVLMALAAGLLADWLIRSRDIGPGRLEQAPILVGAVAAVLWTGYFVALSTAAGLAWPPELTGGAVVLNVVTALGLSLLVTPVPSRAGASDGDRRRGEHAAPDQLAEPSAPYATAAR